MLEVPRNFPGKSIHLIKIQSMLFTTNSPCDCKTPLKAITFTGEG